VSCCAPKGYDKVFGERTARRDARRFRKKGLDEAAQRIVDLLVARGVDGQTVLEVGGGVGGIQIELLRAGAASAVSVELSPAYEDVARELLQESGLEERVERRVLDFARDGDSVGAADVVVMHRVVCCYPDAEGLVRGAAERARHALVLTFPPDTRAARTFARPFNLCARIFCGGFRLYVHRRKAIVGPAESRGLRLAEEGRASMIWRIAALERLDA
jgi:2-polyprenyl-3-methyl-5-hydroxy-6-metoxy-1,4-benzoquinol methylase